MSVTVQQKQQYEKIVDGINEMLADIGALFGNPQKGEFAAVVYEARRYLEHTFLFVNKGMNMLHMAGDEYKQKIIDEAVAEGKVQIAPGAVPAAPAVGERVELSGVGA